MCPASTARSSIRDGRFWLRDTSRNGVFVNDATERVGYGHRVRLDDGDHLRLGLYELVVGCGITDVWFTTALADKQSEMPVRVFAMMRQRARST